MGSAMEGVMEEEVRAGGERFKWPSHTVVNLPKTSSASRQGLSGRPLGGVQGRRRLQAYASWEIFKVPCLETCVYNTHLKPVVVSACFVFSTTTREWKVDYFSPVLDSAN